MAKLLASEAAMWATTKAVQVYGGYGYMGEQRPGTLGVNAAARPPTDAC